MGYPSFVEYPEIAKAKDKILKWREIGNTLYLLIADDISSVQQITDHQKFDIRILVGTAKTDLEAMLADEKAEAEKDKTIMKSGVTN